MKVKRARALWRMKAAKNSGEEFCVETRLELWREHLKDPIVALVKALKCVETQYQG